MVNVYIDESGNLGRSGDFFTIAAVAFPDSHGVTRLRRIIKQSCLRYSSDGLPLKELKVSRLTLPQKQDILNRISAHADHDIFYITVQKKQLRLLQQGRNKNMIYNYLSGILATAIAQKYNDNIILNFDQRSTKVASMNSLADYITLKIYTSINFGHNLYVGQFDSRSMYNLQTADIMAGIINGSYIRGSSHLYSVIKPQIKMAIEFPGTYFNGGMQ